MASSIDPTVPTSGTATTASVRANFDAAKTEIEALQTKTENVTTITAYAGTLLDDATAADARTTLELGTAATTAATDYATAAQGATADTALQPAAIGSSVQAYSVGLTDIAALAVTDGNIIVGNGTTWVAESGSTARTSLGLGSIATQAASAVAITGGAIDGTTIGGSTPAAGTFTTLTATGQVSLGGAAGSESFRALNVASSVAWVEASGTSGSTPSISAQGAGSNLSLSVAAKGSGNVQLRSQSAIALLARSPASAVNYLDALSATTSNRPTLNASGSDTNIDLGLSPKGTGNLVVPIANVLDYADDAAASAGGVAVGGIYRTASVLKIRVS